MMLPRLHYDVNVPARIQSLLSAVCEHTVAENRCNMYVIFVRVWAMNFTRIHPTVTKFQIEKRSKTFSETAGKDRHLFSPQSNEESKDLSRHQNWKAGSILMWPALLGFQLQIMETEDKHMILLTEGHQN